MKNKLFTVVYLIMLALIVPMSAQALNTTGDNSNTLRDRVKTTSDDLQNRREQFKDNLEEKREQLQEKNQEVRSHVAQVHSERLSRRFTFYYNRLSKLIEKISNRFEKMTADGKDLTQAFEKLAQAKTALEEAENLSTQSVAGFGAIEAESYQAQRDQALTARDLAQSAREKFKLVLSLIREAIQLAKTVS